MEHHDPIAKHIEVERTAILARSDFPGFAKDRTHSRMRHVTFERNALSSQPLVISAAEIDEMLDRVGESLDELTVQLRREQIAVVRMPFADALAACADGRIDDAVTAIALLRAQYVLEQRE